MAGECEAALNEGSQSRVSRPPECSLIAVHRPADISTPHSLATGSLAAGTVHTHVYVRAYASSSRHRGPTSLNQAVAFALCGVVLHAAAVGGLA